MPSGTSRPDPRKPLNLRFDSLNTFLLDRGGAAQTPEPLTFTLGADGTAIGFESESLDRFERVTGD